MNGIAKHINQGYINVEGMAIYCEQDIYHSCVIVKGSNTVFINGRGVARIGDPLSSGSIIEDGSKTVFAG